MNDEQENLLHFITGMARSALPSCFYREACPFGRLRASSEQRRRVTKAQRFIFVIK
jgi:hypothetical protein